jgi:cell shape-determining protein MreC
LDGLAPKKRGVKSDPLALENAQLRREITRLEQQLQRAETIIEVQKKISQLLGLPTEPSRQDGNP